MHIHLVSAIFESAAEFKAKNLQETMETILADGLRDRGLTVSVGGHHLLKKWPEADVVHIHHLANACVRLALPQRQSIVFTRHGTDLLPIHHRLVLAQTHRAASAIVALSESERESFDGGPSLGKVHVIGNGIRDAHFWSSLRLRPEPTTPFRLLCVGQLIELKRVEIAIELVAYLRKQGLYVVLDLVYHRATLEQQLRELCRERDVQDRVNFLGPQTREELGDTMRAAHILVHPSRTEALPTVVTEALFTGLPVAAFNVGGIREQVPPGTELPHREDTKSFRDLVVRSLQNYEIEANSAFNYAQVTRTKFSVGSMVDQHIDLYRTLC